MALDLASSALGVLWACNALGALRRRTVDGVSSFLAGMAPATAVAPLPAAGHVLVRLELSELLVLHKPPLWQVDSEMDRNSPWVRGSGRSAGLR